MQPLRDCSSSPEQAGLAVVLGFLSNAAAVLYQQIGLFCFAVPIQALSRLGLQLVWCFLSNMMAVLFYWMSLFCFAVPIQAHLS